MVQPLDPPTRLRLGTHLHPEDGACLMEAVSVLAGEPWTDQPRCTHPVLTALGNTVNDLMTDAGRQTLLPVAPQLIGTASTDRTRTAAIVLACTGHALTAAQRPSTRAHRAIAAAIHRIDRDRPPQAGRLPVALTDLARFLYRSGPAIRAVESAAIAVAAVDPPLRDQFLRELLLVGIRAVTTKTDHP